MFNKSELRKYCLNVRKNLDIAFVSNKIIDKFFSSEEFKKAERIFTYISYNSEIITERILNIKNKEVYTPKVLDREIIMVKYDKNNLVKGLYGILEPDNNNIGIPESHDVIIVPALACDKKLNRLGYGGGYYDKYLAKSLGIKVAFIPQKLLFDEIPKESTDVKMDVIITEI